MGSAWTCPQSFRRPVDIALIPLYLVLLLTLRGLPILLLYRAVLPRAERLSLALLASTGLPLIVVITTIGQADGYLSTPDAAALVMAGMLSVLIFPATVNRRMRQERLVHAQPRAGGPP